MVPNMVPMVVTTTTTRAKKFISSEISNATYTTKSTKLSSVKNVQNSGRITTATTLPINTIGHHHHHHHQQQQQHYHHPHRLLYFGIIFFGLFAQRTHAKIGYFWHISDLHLDTLYSTKGDIHKSCWNMDPRQSSSSGYKLGRFGEYLCDSPWSLLESATLAMKSRQGDNVEFVLWTGDGLSDSSRRKLEPYRLEILRNITDLLGRTFSSQFVFPVLGHNDGPDISFRRLGELWRHWLPSEALQTFEKGGYYTIEQTKSRLRIIALNTNFMQHDPTYLNQVAAVRKRHPNYNGNVGGAGGGGNGNNGGGMNTDSTEYKNFYHHHQHRYHGDSSNMGYGYSNHHYGQIGGIPINGGNGGQVSALSGSYDNQDTQKQWDWLEDVLAKSKSNKETVYIVGHMPPGSDERIIGPSQQHGHSTFAEKNNLRYLRLVRKYSSIIQGQFFGHLHSDSFRIIYDDKGKPVSWIMISPSVTPRKMSVGSNNPAMRLYKFDTDSGQVLDYTQYYLDLTMANTLGEANWIPEYNLTHYYGLADISAISLHNFADRFTMTDNSWFPKYYRANTVRYTTEQCEGICMLNHYCAITRVDYIEYRQCLEKEQSALRSNSINLYSSSSTSLLSIIAIIMLIKNLTKKFIKINFYRFYDFIRYSFACNRQKYYKIYYHHHHNYQHNNFLYNFQLNLRNFTKLFDKIDINHNEQQQKQQQQTFMYSIQKIHNYQVNDDKLIVNKFNIKLCQNCNIIIVKLVRNLTKKLFHNFIITSNEMLYNLLKKLLIIFNLISIRLISITLLLIVVCSACIRFIQKQVLST